MQVGGRKEGTIDSCTNDSKSKSARAFAPNLGLGPPKGVSIDRLSGVGASAGVCLLPWG